jgi:hypothetical protein
MSEWYQFNVDENTGCQCNIKYKSINQLNFKPNQENSENTDYEFFYLNRVERVTLNYNDSIIFMTNFNIQTNEMIKYQYVYNDITTILVLDGLCFLCNNVNELILYFNYNIINIIFQNSEECLSKVNDIKILLHM